MKVVHTSMGSSLENGGGLPRSPDTVGFLFAPEYQRSG